MLYAYTTVLSLAPFKKNVPLLFGADDDWFTGSTKSLAGLVKYIPGKKIKSGSGPQGERIRGPRSRNRIALFRSTEGLLGFTEARSFERSLLSRSRSFDVSLEFHRLSKLPDIRHKFFAARVANDHAVSYFLIAARPGFVSGIVISQRFLRSSWISRFFHLRVSAIVNFLQLDLVIRCSLAMDIEIEARSKMKTINVGQRGSWLFTAERRRVDASWNVPKIIFVVITSLDLYAFEEARRASWRTALPERFQRLQHAARAGVWFDFLSRDERWRGSYRGSWITRAPLPHFLRRRVENGSLGKSLGPSNPSLRSIRFPDREVSSSIVKLACSGWNATYERREEQLATFLCFLPWLAAIRFTVLE